MAPTNAVPTYEPGDMRWMRDGLAHAEVTGALQERAEAGDSTAGETVEQAVTLYRQRMTEIGEAM